MTIIFSERAGLGNILFTYARPVVYTKKHENAKLIWPTWLSLKEGPILRREKDKRLYFDLFRNKSGYIDGIKKTHLLLTKRKIKEKDALAKLGFDEKVVVFEGMDGCLSRLCMIAR